MDSFVAKANVGAGTDALAGIVTPDGFAGAVVLVDDSGALHTTDNRVPVLTTNIAQRIRSACESYPDTDFWEETALASGDFILARGNTGGAGWIEISKDPSTADTETVLSVVEPIRMPIRINAMVSMTHRNAGQQIAQMDFVSDDVLDGLAPLDVPEPIAILNASQTTTTITINFASAPAVPLRVGQIVSVYGFTDTRLNVNSATVATVPSATQITLVGNDYAFASTSIGSTLGSGTAFIERADLLGLARNGVAIIHGNATVTNRRFYARSQGGLARPSGTLAGSHQVSTGTDVATALATGYDTDAWGAPLETVLMASRDAVLVQDRATDANAGYSVRYRSTQIVPNPARTYRTRFRVRSTPSLTRPIAKIVSIVKAGSTTATVTTDVPHGLVTGNYVGFYGVNNQTNFANQTTHLACTVTGANTFTVVHGASATATSYGGFVMRLQGHPALGGAIAQVGQSVTRVGNVVVVTGNATWAAPAVIGNIVQLIGFRNTTNGGDIGIDGAYVVCNLVTSALTLKPVPGQAPTGTDIGATPCGGGVVQRLGFRIHALTAVDYDPLMIEPAFKGTSDAGEAQPVSGTVTSTVTAGTINPVVPATPYFVNSAATTNGALILTGTSGLSAFWATNTGASAAFVKLYNKATAPTVGTDVPEMIIPVPAAVAGDPGVTSIPMGFHGFRFALGLGIAITGAVADSDTTAVAAGQVKVKLSRTV